MRIYNRLKNKPLQSLATLLGVVALVAVAVLAVTGTAALKQDRFSLGTNTVSAAAVNPGILWLMGQKDPAVTGFQPVAGRENLLVSYTISATDSLAFLRGRSWTYDNAAGAIALVLQGQPAAAKQILTALQGLMGPDGSLGFSFQVDSTYTDARVRTGTVAWVGYAMALYQRQTGDTSFQASAEKIGGYLKTLQTASGSIKGGPDVSWISTEHNVDAYFFFRELYRATGKTSYRTTANQIKASLLANHWTGSVTTGHFLQGVNDPVAALDANSWGANFLWAVGRKAQANQALKYVESTFKTTKTFAGANLTGYSPDAAKGTVWLEGTVGVAVSYVRAEQISMATSVYNQISLTVGSNGSLPYAIPRYTNPDGDTFADLPSVPATAWHQIILHVGVGSSRFWNAD